jgi:hypothetical protein
MAGAFLNGTCIAIYKFKFQYAVMENEDLSTTLQKERKQ